MRFYDLIETPKTGKTFLGSGEGRISQDDERVICWFQPLPAGYSRAYDKDGFPFNEKIETSISEDQLIAQNESSAKSLRDSTIESDIEVFGVMWQVDSIKDEPRIKRAIHTAEYNNLDESESRNWILSDNSVRETTAQDLMDVISAKAFREGVVFDQYSEWRAGDRLTPFEYEA